jgi:hypothetical protein
MYEWTSLALRRHQKKKSEISVLFCCSTTEFAVLSFLRGTQLLHLLSHVPPINRRMINEPAAELRCKLEHLKSLQRGQIISKCAQDDLFETGRNAGIFLWRVEAQEL